MDKHGWLKIVEAFIAILMVVGVLLVLRTNQTNSNDIAGQEILKIQTYYLNQITSDPLLRTQILNNDTSGINALLKIEVPTGLNYTTKICNYDRICSLDNDDLVKSGKNIYASYSIVSSTLTKYDPAGVKIIKIFMWYN